MIDLPQRLERLDKSSLLYIQKALTLTSWYKGEIDGVFNKDLKNAWVSFKLAHYQADLDLVGKGSLAILVADVEDVGGFNTHPIPKEKTESKEKLLTSLLPSGLQVTQNSLIISSIPLTWGEVTKNLTRKPETALIEANIIETAKVFGVIRQKLGSPITVTSGYRPPAINKAVGGVPNSQHQYGLALDVTSTNLKDLLLVIRQILKSRGSGGIGLGMDKGFIHFDIGKSRKSVIEFNY